MPANGSSNSINLGSIASERAISVLRLSPPLSCIPLLFLMCCNPNSSNNCSSFSACSFCVNLVNSNATRMLFSTDKFLKILGSCAKYPIPSFAL
ncbi:MAG: hypothetical protein BWX61_01304 [Bacteroidetes bacterium ADurb.Bin035]|nr:MAG: hypothetical protein BWX61_01304 [Bacteroidetes bacterium ADurb.Bin035]